MPLLRRSALTAGALLLVLTPAGLASTSAHGASYTSPTTGQPSTAGSAQGANSAAATGAQATGNPGAATGTSTTAAPTSPGPTATTEPATQLTPASARLNGTSADAVEGDSYHFDWGPTSAYGNSTRETTITRGTIASGRRLSAQLGGLSAGTTYHARLVVSSCGGCATGTTDGADITFTTAVPAAAAQLGRSAVAAALAGTVTVKRPGARGFSVLSAAATVPDGAVINTTHGRLRITSALPGGRTQAATVWGGQLTVSQNRLTGRTTFRLVGPLSCPVASRGLEHRAVLMREGARRTTRRRPRRPPVRRLWARDNHGLYTTRGNNSVATVRGTVWETIESCAGTRTLVARGVVAVRDLHRHLTVLVSAGHSYLARR